MGVRLSSGGPIIWSIQLVKSSGGRFHHLTFLDPLSRHDIDDHVKGKVSSRPHLPLDISAIEKYTERMYTLVPRTRNTRRTKDAQAFC